MYILNEDIDSSRESIEELFFKNLYEGEIYSVEPPIEGERRIVYIRLKPPFPSSIFLQITLLWKLWELHLMEDFYLDKAGNINKNLLFEYFEYFILDHQQRRFLTQNDLRTVIGVLNKAQMSIEKDPNFILLGGKKVGIYLNDSYLSSKFPDDIKQEIMSHRNGEVFRDNDDFFAILENDSLALLHWYWIE